MNSQPNNSGRLLLIDGLRGVAAFLVLLFHISKVDFFNMAPGWVEPLNRIADAVGFLGVEIFFVISGFVIAYSMRNARVTGRYAGGFAIRRSLRLDPPYWATIAVTTVIYFVFTRFLHATTYPVPSGSTLAAHLFYMQGILHKPQILIVFWTLCYEIQFYLGYLLIQFAAQRIGRTAAGTNRVLTVILTTTGLASLYCFIQDPTPGAWCYTWWFLFAFGALICRQMLVSAKVIVPFAAALLIGATVYCGHLEPLAGALTGLLLYAAIRLEKLSRWLSAPPIQYLGRISYSLYLTHILTLQILAGVLIRVPLASAFHSIPAYLLLLGVPIVGAHLFYRLVEKPSHQLAIRFGRNRKHTSPVIAPFSEAATPEEPVLSR